MDNLLMETNSKRDRKNQIPDEFGFAFNERKKKTGGNAADSKSDPTPVDPAEDDAHEVPVYSICQNGPRRLTAYSKIFVN